MITEDFIKSHCLKCPSHIFEGYSDMGDHFCMEEVKYAEGIGVPSIDEMEGCPLEI